jgi:hypothetical protein
VEQELPAYHLSEAPEFTPGFSDCSQIFISTEKSLKIPKGQSESEYRRRTDNTMAKRKNTKGQTTIYKTYT